MRLLLAEDERELSAALQAVLKRNHYEVDAVYDGGEAYDYLQTGNYDGFILDVMMPVMNGLEFLKELKARNITEPKIIASNYNEFEYVRQGMKLGASDYLLKPISEEELRECLINVRDEIQDNEERSITEIIFM